MKLNTIQKTWSGSALVLLAGLGIVLSAILGWTSLPRPFGFLVGLLFGIAVGAGVALVISGLRKDRLTREK